MENKQPSVMDLLIETHEGLEQQGPGSHDPKGIGVSR